MAKLYTKNTWTDEELADVELYDVKESTDEVIYEDVKIELATEVLTAGTQVTAARMNNIEEGIDLIDSYLFAAATENKNIIIDGGFTVNQRGYVSAATLASGTYGHDRWKAGAGGGNYSFTQLAGPTTITIAAGKTLIQVVENKNVIGGTYTLSWVGTAQGRYAVDSATPSGAYADSPIVITGQTAGTTMSVEFNAGTLGNVQLESGAVATAFDFRPYAEELALCKRYCQSVYMPTFVANGTTVVYGFATLQIEMFGNPSATQPVALGITDVISANFIQSPASVSAVYSGKKAFAANYANFTGLTSGRLYFNQPSASDGPTLLTAEL